MISINEKELIKKAKKCNSCLDWHHYCQSECCSTIYINIDPSVLKRPGKILIVGKILDEDMIWYYKLHGIKYCHGLIHVPKEYCVVSNDRIIYKKDCSLLKNLLCLGHADKKPNFCKKLDVKYAKENQSILTPNCLFKYKNVEVDTNE